MLRRIKQWSPDSFAGRVRLLGNAFTAFIFLLVVGWGITNAYDGSMPSMASAASAVATPDDEAIPNAVSERIEKHYILFQLMPDGRWAYRQKIEAVNGQSDYRDTCRLRDIESLMFEFAEQLAD